MNRTPSNSGYIGKAGVTVALTVRVASAVDVDFYYGEDIIHSEPGVVDSYTYNYTPVVGGKLFSVYSTSTATEDILSTDGSVPGEAIIDWAATGDFSGNRTYDQLISQPNSYITLPICPQEMILGDSYSATVEVSNGTYNGNGLSVFIGGQFKGYIATDATYIYTNMTDVSGNDLKFVSVDANGFDGDAAFTELTHAVPVPLELDAVEIIRDWHTAYNNGACVIKFKDRGDHSGFTSFVQFQPELMSIVNNTLVSFKDGYLYTHDGDGNTFFGSTYNSVIAYRILGHDGAMRILRGISVESDVRPSYIHVVAKNMYDQETDLCEFDLVYSEGLYYAPFMNNKLSPGFNDTSEGRLASLLNGEEMRNTYFDLFLIYDKPFRLSSVNHYTELSSGHKQ